jgi:lysophospholipase L1-like esterase
MLVVPMKKVFFYLLLFCIFLFADCKKQQLSPTNNKLEVINLGVPGNTARDLLARIKDVTNLKPDLVIIMIGTNDAGSGGKIYRSFRSNLDRIINKIQEANAKVILLTPPPCLPSSKFYGNREKLDLICSTISAVSKDKSCEVVDIHSYISSVLKQTDSVSIYNPDGIHPNKTGYSDISNFLLSYFRQHPLNRGFKIVCFGDSITYGYEVDGQGTSNGDTYPADLLRGIYYSLMSDHKFSETQN